MSITAGFGITCATSNCPAGIARVYLANKDDIDTTVGIGGFTAGTTGIFTAVTMNGADTFFEFDFQDYTAEVREEPTPNANGCGYSWQQQLEMTFPCWTVEARNALDELVNSSCCGLVAIVERFDGSSWAFGYLEKRHLKVLSAPAVTGKAITDSQSMVLTFQAITTEPMRSFTGTVPV